LDHGRHHPAARAAEANRLNLAAERKLIERALDRTLAFAERQRKR
jgi:hypothetical protein